MGGTEIRGSGSPQPHQLQTSTRRHTNDPKYGGLVYLSPHTATAYQQLSVEQKNMDKFIEIVTRRKSLLHNNLLTVKNHFCKQEKSSSFSCSKQDKHEFYLQYPYLKRSLEDVIQEHSQKGIALPEKEIVRVFSAVVGVLKFLQKNGTCHGDFKAGNILFDHLGTPKLIDSYFINGGKTAYQIVLENPSSMSLLSPEQLARIKHRQNQDISTIHQSQVFMVGLTMIESMTFQAAMECYNLEALEIVEGYYERKAKELFHGPYSRKLCELALRCVEEELSQRPSFDEILSGLRGAYI